MNKKLWKSMLANILITILMTGNQWSYVRADTLGMVSTNEVSVNAIASMTELDEELTDNRKIPNSPKHICPQDDSTDWSYIYFGSYPQTQITEQSITERIEQEISNSGIEESRKNPESSSTDIYADVQIGSIKYRRLRLDYGEEDESHQYAYFRFEPIKWRVLQNLEGKRFVCSDMTLDYCYYGRALIENNAWGDSEIRQWLNRAFYDEAFSEDEKKGIIKTDGINSNYDMDAENSDGNVEDNIFLLSHAEVTDTALGFCPDEENLSNSRKIKGTEYTYVLKNREYGDYEGKVFDCDWILRTVYRDEGYIMVSDSGNASWNYSQTDKRGIVPALMLDESSNQWSYAGNSSGGGKDEPSNPIYYGSLEDYTTWDSVYFGTYPQLSIWDDATCKQIDAQIASEGLLSTGEGIDVTVGGKRYRRISINDTNNPMQWTHYSNGEDVEYCYFLWEPIQWRVLQVDGEKMTLCTNSVLDCKCYQNNGEATTWEKSDIRTWLNEQFYNTAFSKLDRDEIVKREGLNSGDSKYDSMAGSDTADKVFLLSNVELQTSEYGFCINGNSNRVFPYSKYSITRGANAWGEWWTRTLYNDTNAKAVNYQGEINYGMPLSRENGGIVPVIEVKLSSETWTNANPVCSRYFLCNHKNTEIEYKGKCEATCTQYGYTGDAYCKQCGKQISQGSYMNPVGHKGGKATCIKKAVCNLCGQEYGELDTNNHEKTILRNAKTAANNEEGYTGDEYCPDCNVLLKRGTGIPRLNEGEGVPSGENNGNDCLKTGTAFTDKTSNAAYKVTSSNTDNPTVSYTGTTEKKKKEIAIPSYVSYNGVKYKVTSVTSKAFKGNKKVTSIKISASVSKLGDSAFENCSNLKTVMVGSGVTSIGKNTFRNCKRLNKLIIKSKKLKTIGKKAFSGINSKCQIKVPKAKLKTYQKLFKGKGQKSSVKITK